VPGARRSPLEARIRPGTVAVVESHLFRTDSAPRLPTAPFAWAQTWRWNASKPNQSTRPPPSPGFVCPQATPPSGHDRGPSARGEENCPIHKLRNWSLCPLCGRPRMTGKAEATAVLQSASLLTALRIGSQGLQNWAGRGAGFRDFLCLPSAKENRSNRRTLPLSFERNKVDPSNLEGWGKRRPAGRRPFP
jgi:hypothetical protein